MMETTFSLPFAYSGFVPVVGLINRHHCVAITPLSLTLTGFNKHFFFVGCFAPHGYKSLVSCCFSGFLEPALDHLPTQAHIPLLFVFFTYFALASFKPDYVKAGFLLVVTKFNEFDYICCMYKFILILIQVTTTQTYIRFTW